ncbi:MAG: N-acetylmuramoyl-L-alanine amidase [Clostridia bacterium]|nr:N-acetylmuramoyl-L-alanine amidase [Clostridia bacterium]
MKNTSLLRAIALLLCLTLLCATGLAESVDGESDLLESPVQEQAEFSLAPEGAEALPDAVYAENAAEEEAVPAEDAAPAADIVAAESPALIEDADATASAEAASQAQDAVPQAPVESAPAAVEAPGIPAEDEGFEGEQQVAAAETDASGARSFAQTAAVESETWQGVNLVRAAGFTGALARVNGQLTLANVTIDGRPAREVDLGAYFTLGPTGSVAIQDDAALALSLSAFSFNKGSKKTLSVQWNGAGLAAKKAKWKTSNSKVAKVSKGKIRAKKAGTAVITATYQGATASCLVVVTDYKQVKSLKMGQKKLTLALYGSVQLGLTIKPADAFNPAITWSSSNPAVVSVDANGWVAGLSGGTATVTALSGNGKKASCKVTVKEVKPTAVKFAKPYLSLNPGNTFATRIEMTPAAVSNPAVSYSSSNAAVATVDAKGVVTVTGYGTAVITATCAADSGVKGTCRVSVLQPGHKRMEGLIIGINPGHQRKTISTLYPLAPGSSKKAKGVKTGACGKWTRVNEYETTLAIGLKLRDILTEAGATVVITRTTNDVMLTNIDRAKMLNDAGVDVALQLHCNSISNQKAEGNSAYIRTTTEWADVNRAIGEAITAAISAECGCKNLGVKVNNNYMSLNWTTTPSVLLEMGYISNKKEDELLASDEYRTRMAMGIFEGLCAYYGR